MPGPGPADAHPARLSWIDQPARRQPGRLALLTAVVVAVSASIVMADGDVLLALVAAAVLLISVAPFLAPTRYTLTGREIIVQMPGWTRRRRWEDLRRWDEGPAGFFVSPFTTRRGLVEDRRGLALRGGDRDAIRAWLIRHLGDAPRGRGEESTPDGRSGDAQAARPAPELGSEDR